MSGVALPKFSETAAEQDDETHSRGTARLGRGAEEGVGSQAKQGATAVTPQLPPSGRKSLSPWGSYQMELDGAGRDASRRRPQVPTLGPLSYSLPVTPQGRHGQRTFARDADLACEAAEGWSVPPMPYGDLAYSGDPSRQSMQSFEQQGNDKFPEGTAAPTTISPSGGWFAGGGVSSLSMPSKLLSSRESTEAGSAAAVAAVDGDDARHRSVVEAEVEWMAGSRRGADGLVGSGDGQEEEAAEEDAEEECHARGAEAAENEAQSNDASGETTETVVLIPPDLRQPLHSPLSSPPPPPPDAALAVAAVAAADSERFGMMEARPDFEGMTRSAGARPAMERLVPESTPQTSEPESLLERVAKASRLAGVVFDPSLEDEIESVLARERSPFLAPPSTASPAEAFLAPPSPPCPGMPMPRPERAPPAKALGARAENPWGWAPPLYNDGAARRVEDGGLAAATGATVGTSPSRERSWTVPSPYQHLDDRFASARRVPDFRLDGGVGDAGTASREELLRSWKECLSCGGVPASAGHPPAATDGGSSEAHMRTGGPERVAVAAAAPAGMTADGDADPTAESQRSTEVVAAHVTPVTAAANSAATFASSLQDRPGGVGYVDLEDGGDESDTAGMVVGSGHGVRRASPEPPGDHSWEGERDERPSNDDGQDIPGGVSADAHRLETVAGEQMEVGDGRRLPSPTAREGVIFAAAITEASLEDESEARPGRESRGGEPHSKEAGAAEQGSMPSLLSMGSFDLGLSGGGGAVDEWVDDLDPGFMVLAVSEKELRYGELHQQTIGVGIDAQHERHQGGGDADAPTEPPPRPPSVEDATVRSRECAPGHESSDDGGDGDGRVGGGGGGGSGESRRRSWAGRSLEEFGVEEDPVRRRRASSADERVTEEKAFASQGSTGATAAAESKENEEVRQEGTLEGHLPWEARCIEQQRDVVAGGGGGGDGGAEKDRGGKGEGGEYYGDGNLYERDLEDAVALLENGLFMFDREQVEAWRNESFSSSTAGGGGGDDGEKDYAAGHEEDGVGCAADASVERGREDRADTRLGVAPSAATADEEAAAAVMSVAGSGGGGGIGSGGGWDNVRSSSSRRQFVDGGYEGDERESGESAEHDGSFDPMSSLWPRSAADFAFSQDCAESSSFLDRERDFSSTEERIYPGNSARTIPIDEAFREAEHTPVAREYSHHPVHHRQHSRNSDGGSLRSDESSGRQGGWSVATRREPSATPAAARGSGKGSGAGSDGDGGTAAGDTGGGAGSGFVRPQQQGQQQEVLLHLRADERVPRGPGASAAGAGDSGVDTAAAAVATTGASGSSNATATAARGGRLLGVLGSGAGLEWGGGRVISGAQRLLQDDKLLEEADRDGRVSRRSRSGSSRRVTEEMGPSGGGFRGESAAMGMARQAAGTFGDEGVEEHEEEEEELESFDLRVIYTKGRTGFQESKAFDWPEGYVVAGRYEVCGYIGKAAFSTALECRDLRRERGRDAVCLKVIKNNKDFFDQSLDEIKLLQRIKANGNPDEHHVLHMLDFFYFEEHLVIVSELLGDNLYEFSKAVKEAGHPEYFTLPRLCKIIRQCLEALSYINSLGLVHCDVKPENILLSHYGRAEVKLIDFGSSCFVTDRLTTYTQSRSYRAPEVILGLPYGAKVDVWSLGAVVVEMVTGHVLLQSESIQTMLARIQGIVGPFPRWMLLEGEEASKYFTSEGFVYQKMDGDSYRGSSSETESPGFGNSRPSRSREDFDECGGSSTSGRYAIIYPKMTSLKRRLRVGDDDDVFLDFVTTLLSVDPISRPTATEALCHPWILSGLSYSDDELWYPPEEGHIAQRQDSRVRGGEENGAEDGGIDDFDVSVEMVFHDDGDGDNMGGILDGEVETMSAARRRSF